MTEHPEAEIQASAASLSPVSPSPLHTASPLVVPTLQDTVDTIDAMVAAAAATNGQVAVADLNNNSVPEPNPEHKVGAHDAADEDVVDDDDDPYGDEAAEEPANGIAPAQAQPAQDDGNDDDYANTFDSPINPEEGAEDEQQPEDVPRAQHEGDSGAHKPVPDDTQSRDVSASAEKAEHEAALSSNEQPTAADVAIDQLVADITAQQHPTTSTATSHDSSIALAPTEPEKQDSQPAMPTVIALPSAASLPPRPPQPATPGDSLPSQHHPGAPGPAAEDQEPAAEAPAAGTTSEDDYQRNWERFIADERQYMTEAKWDRFPEGSRIFIGNLSSDKVSKRDVFDIFYRFGRLAQISLKSAYGFVQYHTVEEGSSALQHLEGYEVKGRRIHLEISKLQDKGKKNDRRSPDRDRDRGGRDSRRNGRHENRGRNQSPRRGNYNDGYRRDSGYGDRRNRSRSPEYGRHGNAHRQRSPMGYGHRSSGSGPDMPQRRFGADVPDVQLLLAPGLNPDFIAWVEQPFKDKGLAVKSMYIDPRAGGKDQIIQQQAADGVHAVIELDMRAQNMGKVPALAFDRSNGNANVRFDQYADLEPHVVAAVVLDKKSSHARQGYQTPYTAPQGYGQQPYVGHQPQHQPPPAVGNYYGAPPQAYPAQPHAFPPQAPAHQAAPAQADLAAIMGKLDPATLQQVIAAASGSGAASTDVGAILGALNTQQQAHHPQAPHHPHYQTQLPPQQQYGAPYGGQSAQSGDSAAQVQNIMAQLAKYR